MMEIDVPMLSQPGVNEFIRANERIDEHQLVLKQKTVQGVSGAILADQIRALRKAAEKLPTWYKTPGIIYPRLLNLEQSSSEMVAAYRAEIIREFIPGAFSGADLTGGFGVDTFFLSRVLGETTYVEPDANLLAIARHNHQLLGAKNITWVGSDAARFLQQRGGTFDILYIDPSRRDEDRKYFRLADCEPDVISLQESWFNHTRHVLIKVSPLLDITQALREVRHVAHVFVIAVSNDVKELLLLCHSLPSEPAVHAVNLRPPSQGIQITSRPPSRFDFRPEEERGAVVTYSEPGKFLYEPDATILKAGAFKLVGQRFGLAKLHPGSHLYTTSNYLPDFPGRAFEVTGQVKLDKELKEKYPRGFANIIVRNHPMTVEEIKKKTGLSEGGELFLVCTRGVDKKFALMCRRLS